MDIQKKGNSTATAPSGVTARKPETPSAYPAKAIAPKRPPRQPYTVPKGKRSPPRRPRMAKAGARVASPRSPRKRPSTPARAAPKRRAVKRVAPAAKSELGERPKKESD